MITDANELWTTCCNLRTVCDTLLDPTQRIDHINVALMQPYKPMLAQRGDIGVDKVALRLMLSSDVTCTDAEVHGW
jgi:hypothetical protein